MLTVVGSVLLVGGTFTLYHQDTFGASDATVLEDEGLFIGCPGLVGH